LDLDTFDLTFEVLKLGPLVAVLVTLGDGFFTQASSLEVFLIKEALGAGKLVIQVQVMLSSSSHQKFKIRHRDIAVIKVNLLV